MKDPTPQIDSTSTARRAPRVPDAVAENVRGFFALAVTQWDRFWFQARDAYSLAVLRLLAGGMLLYSHLVWGKELEAFFGAAGWNNAGVVQALQSDSYAMSFWWYVPDSWLMPVHVVCCLVLAMFFLGAFTRITSVLAFVISVSYANRAMLANYGLDQIITVLVLYLTLAPCGQYLSIDAWRRRWATGQANRIQPSVMANVSCRLVQCHLCVMYLFAGTSKLQGISWWNGDAVWETLANYEYQSWDLTFLAAFPFVTHVATHLTVAWEISFSALVWNRYLRPFVLLIGSSMHLGIGMFLGMWTFGLAMMFGYVTFVPSSRLWYLVHGICRIPAASVPAGEVDLPPRWSPSESNVSDTGESSETSLLIIVCQSVSTRIKALRYFHGYGQRVLLVDGMDQAVELCRAGTGTVVSLDARFSAQDGEYWTQRIVAANPQTGFIFFLDGVESPAPSGKARIISRPATLRKIRSAIESLTGREMQRVEFSYQPDDEGTTEGYADAIDTILARQSQSSNLTTGSGGLSPSNRPR